MRRLNDHQGRTLRFALFTIILAAFTAGAFAAVPVTVAVAVNGDPAPGATVTAKATVTTTDGSAVQSIKWTQVGGVPATLTNTNTDTITIVMPARKVFREHLIEVLEEPPLNGGVAPPKFDPSTYEGGLQNRFTVVGISPLSAEHAVALSFKITVVTSSGTYDVPAAVDANLHFPTDLDAYRRSWDAGIRCVVMQGGQGDVKHWAFNDPPRRTEPHVDDQPPPAEYRKLATRIVDLHPLTIAQNARTSGGGNIALVPTQAMTVGPVETWKAEKVSIWHAGMHDNPFGQRLTTLMISKGIGDAAVPMSLLADHPNVQFNFYRGGIGTCVVEMH